MSAAQSWDPDAIGSVRFQTYSYAGGLLRCASEPILSPTLDDRPCSIELHQPFFKQSCFLFGLPRRTSRRMGALRVTSPNLGTNSRFELVLNQLGFATLHNQPRTSLLDTRVKFPRNRYPEGGREDSGGRSRRQKKMRGVFVEFL